MSSAISDQPFQDLPEGYELHRADLRQGYFGDVCRCYKIKNPKEIYTFKRILRKSESQNGSEIVLLQKLQELKRHPNIIELIDSDHSQQYLITPWYPKGDLKTFMKTRDLSLSEAHFIFARLARGVQFLHANKILHGDLKPGNIFLEADLNPRIGDFGLSKLIDQPAKDFSGTLSYMAPELLEIPENGYGLEVDIWALGCIAYRLLEQESYLPSSEKDYVKFCALMKNSFLKFRHLDDSDAQELIRCMLVKNPSERIKIDNISRSPFILDPLFANGDEHGPFTDAEPSSLERTSTSTHRLERKLKEILEAAHSSTWTEFTRQSLPNLQDMNPETWIRRFLDSRTSSSSKSNSGFVAQLADGSVTATYMDKLLVVSAMYKNFDLPTTFCMNAEKEYDWIKTNPHSSYGFGKSVRCIELEKLVAASELTNERTDNDKRFIFVKLAGRTRDGKYLIVLSNKTLQCVFPESGSILLCPQMLTVTLLSSERQEKRVYHLDDIKKQGCDSKILDKLQFALHQIHKFRSHIDKCQ